MDEVQKVATVADVFMSGEDLTQLAHWVHGDAWISRIARILAMNEVDIQKMASGEIPVHELVKRQLVDQYARATREDFLKCQADFYKYIDEITSAPKKPATFRDFVLVRLNEGIKSVVPGRVPPQYEGLAISFPTEPNEDFAQSVSDQIEAYLQRYAAFTPEEMAVLDGASDPFGALIQVLVHLGFTDEAVQNMAELLLIVRRRELKFTLSLKLDPADITAALQEYIKAGNTPSVDDDGRIDFSPDL